MLSSRRRCHAIIFVAASLNRGKVISVICSDGANADCTAGDMADKARDTGSANTCDTRRAVTRLCTWQTTLTNVSARHATLGSSGRWQLLPVDHVLAGRFLVVVRRALGRDATSVWASRLTGLALWLRTVGVSTDGRVRHRCRCCRRLQLDTCRARLGVGGRCRGRLLAARAVLSATHGLVATRFRLAVRLAWITDSGTALSTRSRLDRRIAATTWRSGTWLPLPTRPLRWWVLACVRAAARLPGKGFSASTATVI